ncbi:ABC-2 transporter permease [Paenibacillus koleovorans]|uniref:ABC-2 transporter permease n=1 Tax=Paenibacillus koleovorans TaxID=121608 RepID=UPI000FD8055B|nr:ABC-2 transporter permease [Paenibacillus koleovorans]
MMVAQLLVKDLRVTRKFILLGLAFVGFFCFALGAFEGLPLAVPAAILGHFLTVTASKMDERNNNGMLLASLPVRRRDLVTAKYMSLLLFTGLAFLLTLGWRLVGGAVLAADELPSFQAGATLIALLALAVFYAVYFPLYFQFGPRAAHVLDIIVMFTLAAGGLAAMRAMEWFGSSGAVEKFRSWWNSAGDGSLALWCAVLIVGLLTASWLVSVLLYERRDL